MSIFGPKYKGARIDPAKRVSPLVSTPRPRVESAGPLKAKFTPHTGTAREKKQYTGTEMLGICTMHKSNAVPVFSADSAVDISKMRRG